MVVPIRKTLLSAGVKACHSAIPLVELPDKEQVLACPLTAEYVTVASKIFLPDARGVNLPVTLQGPVPMIESNTTALEPATDVHCVAVAPRPRLKPLAIPPNTLVFTGMS